MAYTGNDRLNAINALLEELEDVESLILEAKMLVTKMRRKFADEVEHLPGIGTFNYRRIALFWMGEIKSHFWDSTSPTIEACLKKASTTNVNTDRWVSATRFQIEQDLWSLWINKMGSADSSLNARMLSDCFDVLVSLQSSLLGVMGWLFPELTDRLGTIADITRSIDIHSWPVRDRMLFWISHIRDAKCRLQKGREITTRILDMQLSSGAFVAIEGKNCAGDLIASAIGLLALISCANRNCFDKNIIVAVRQATHWIVGHVTEANDEGLAWTYYALCEYIELESSTNKR